MKKKLVFPAMLVCLLALGLVLVGCPTDPGDGGGSGIDNWSTLLGKWKWQEESYNIQLEFKTELTMGGHSFSQSRNLPDGQGGGTVFVCSYIGTTLRKYDAETNTTEQTFTVIVSDDGQTLTFSDYQDPEGKGDYSYLNGKTYTKQQ